MQKNQLKDGEENENKEQDMDDIMAQPKNNVIS